MSCNTQSLGYSPQGRYEGSYFVTFRNFAGQMAFLLWQTGHPEFQPSK